MSTSWDEKFGTGINVWHKNGFDRISRQRAVNTTRDSVIYTDEARRGARLDNLTLEEIELLKRKHRSK